MVRVVHFRTSEELVHAVRDASGYPAGRLVARERYTASPAQGSRQPIIRYPPGRGRAREHPPRPPCSGFARPRHFRTLTLMGALE